MIALKISNKKEFMARLLTTDLFDAFLVEEATIDTFNTFHIDGRIHKDFYKNDPDYSEDGRLPSNSCWGDIRPICLSLIKGKRTPLGFKFILKSSDSTRKELVEKSEAGIMDDQVNLGLNIRFLNDEIIITTGISISIFTLDKSIEKTWDQYVPGFLEANNIITQDYG